MADDVTLPGTGSKVASDDDGTRQYQWVKIVWGPDDTYNKVDVATGKPLPIQHRVADGTAWTYGAGAIGAGTPRVALASDSPGIIVGLTAGTQASPSAGYLSTVAAGDIAHDAADSGNPTKIGLKAIAHGANPTAVAAADRTNWYANRAGVAWIIGGHPNTIRRSHIITDTDGAQTNAALLTISAGSVIVITQIAVTMDGSNSAAGSFRVGFGASTIPASSLAGTSGIVGEGKFAANGGLSLGNGGGVIAVGADGEDLRLTCSDPAGGNLYVTYSYYTIES